MGGVLCKDEDGRDDEGSVSGPGRRQTMGAQQQQQQQPPHISKARMALLLVEYTVLASRNALRVYLIVCITHGALV